MASRFNAGSRARSLPESPKVGPESGPHAAQAKQILLSLEQSKKQVERASKIHAVKSNLVRFFRDAIEEMLESKLITEGRFGELSRADDTKLDQVVSTKELMKLAVHWRITSGPQDFWSKNRKREDLIEQLRDFEAERHLKAEEGEREAEKQMLAKLDAQR